MALIGLVRVSTDRQKTQRQHDALDPICLKVIEERASGKLATGDRPDLLTALSYIREGDLLTVQEVDRLGRNLLEGLIVLNDLFQQGVGVKVLEGIAVGEHTERSFILDLALALAEDRRRDIVRKTKNGLEAARRHGRVGGRRPVVDDDKRAAILDRSRRGESIRTIAAGVKVSVGTVHKILAAAQVDEQTPSPSPVAVEAVDVEPVDVEPVDQVVPQVRPDARTAKARAAWDGLNGRQQAYLAAIYRADQVKEERIRRDAAAGQTTPKAEVWRWVSFSEGSVFAAGAKTDLQRELRQAGVWDSGAGATLEALRSRGVIEVRHDRSALGSPLVAVRLTTSGRAAARAGLGVTRATRPKGLLSHGLWGQLVKAVRAEQAGKPLDSLWRQTHLYLGTGYTFRGHPSRGYLEWRKPPAGGSRYYLTETGRAHIGVHLEDYRRLYPDIDVTSLLDPVDVDHLEHDLDLTEDIGPGWRLVLRRGDLETGTWQLHHDDDVVATLHFEHGPGQSMGWAVRLSDGTPLPDDAPTPTVTYYGNWARLRHLSAATAAWLQRPASPVDAGPRPAPVEPAEPSAQPGSLAAMGTRPRPDLPTAPSTAPLSRRSK